MQITVPPAPDKASSWRKTIKNLVDAKGGAAVKGEWLDPGNVVELPAGTLVLSMDKTTTGWDYGYRSGERFPVQDATVTVHLAAADDGLRQLWSRHYKQASSAFGATTMKKLAALLGQHPAPDGEVRVLVEAQRPNRREGECRWCHGTVYAGRGHLVGHGETIDMEHWQKCPTRVVTPGTPCTLCGVTVGSGLWGAPAEQILVREGAGRWETRHVEVVHCTANPPESYEDYTARQDAERRERDAANVERVRKEREAQQRRLVRADQRRAAAAAAEAAEAARVAGLTETGRTVANLNDKGLGGNRRAALGEITVRLSDGTTTTRWEVRTYYAGSGWTGEDYDPDEGEASEYTSKADAQAAYRALKFQPVQHSYSGGTCDGCGRGRAVFERRDSSGIPGKVCPSCNRHEDYELSFA